MIESFYKHLAVYNGRHRRRSTDTYSSDADEFVKVMNVNVNKNPVHAR